VGWFTAPLQVTQAGEDANTLKLKNNGTEELRHLFLYAVRNHQAKFLFVPELAPGASRQVEFSSRPDLSSLSDARDRIAEEMTEALVSEGLFRPEAQAMVKTWDDSWFSEPGVRVLYVLPRTWTDRILPLILEPKTKDVVRVMVGRAELITPRMEWDLMKQIVRSTDPDAGIQAKAIEETRHLGLGRFLEPAIRRLETKLFTQELSTSAGKLLRSVSNGDKSGKGLAAR
jgi:hypothetical protein